MVIYNDSLSTVCYSSIACKACGMCLLVLLLLSLAAICSLECYLGRKAHYMSGHLMEYYRLHARCIRFTMRVRLTMFEIGGLTQKYALFFTCKLANYKRSYNIL